MRVYIDADACPVKEEAIKVATRHGLGVTMVSNSGMRLHGNTNVENVMVGAEFDAADNWIADHVNAGDIVVTADIQLAARCLQKQGFALGPSGQLFTQENIGSALSLRELNGYLREAREIKGYNAPFSPKDRSRFLQSLDRVIQKYKNSR